MNLHNSYNCSFLLRNNTSINTYILSRSQIMQVSFIKLMINTFLIHLNRALYALLLERNDDLKKLVS